MARPLTERITDAKDKIDDLEQRLKDTNTLLQKLTEQHQKEKFDELTRLMKIKGVTSEMLIGQLTGQKEVMNNKDEKTNSPFSEPDKEDPEEGQTN
jgi:septal ring factor EnvC (AmiA/AmiB activator)